MRLQAIATLAALFIAPALADPISGYVNADGTPRIASSLYFVIHRGHGRYDIQFTTPMQPSASCIISPVPAPKSGSAAPYVRKLDEASTHCLFTLARSAGGHADADFSFIAVPMSN